MKYHFSWLAAVYFCSSIGCVNNDKRQVSSYPTLHDSHTMSKPTELPNRELLGALDPAVVQASGMKDAEISAVSNLVVTTDDSMLTTQAIELSIPSTFETTLDELVNLALANNPAIKELAATTQKAAGYRTQVGLYANPILGYQGQQLADKGTDQHLLFAEQEFATGNKLQLNRQVQNEALRAQLQELEAQKLRVATDVQCLYYQAFGYQKQLTQIKDFRGLLEKGHELAQLKMKTAEGSKIDVLQTKVQLSEIDLTYRQTVARYDATWREITAVAGIHIVAPTELVTEFPPPDESICWEELASTLIYSSPEYAAAQARICQARAELERHGVQAVPNLTVQFGAGVDNSTDSGMMNLQVGAPIPIFNQNQGNLVAARAEHCRSLMEAQRIKHAILARLAIVSRDFETSLEAVTSYGTDILPSAQEALTLAEAAYKAGEIDFIQLLVARRTFFESNLQYVDSQAQLAAAKAKLDGFVLFGSLDAVIDRSGSDSLRGLTFSQQ